MTLVLRCGLNVSLCLVLAGCAVAIEGTARTPDTSLATVAPATAWPSPGSGVAEPINVLPAGNAPPPFPDTVTGYSLADERRETVRAFEGDEWSTIYDFPATMNGCALQRFYIRWRAVNTAATVEVTFLSSEGQIVLNDPVAGAAGWMSGYGCDQPAFRLKSSDDESTLTDIVVEVQRWEVSV